jgi:hypothetical protein
VIDWISIFFNSFWIVGLALLLAALSYQQWEAQQTQTKLRDRLNHPSFMRPFWLAFILICIGLAGTSGRIWETAIWCFFIIIGLINIVLLKTQPKG